MNRRWTAGVWLAAMLWTTVLPAEERYVEFLDGLRERQYYDLALQYLDQLKARPEVPAEMKELVPLEKALTLQDAARISRSPETQTEQLDQALAFLEEFVKASPNHPRAGDANAQRAEILLGKARVEIIQSRSPANQGAKGEYQQRARGLIQQARKVFQTAYDQHDATWKAFGSFIDKQKDPQKFADRAAAELQMISALLNLGQCTYEEAQTWELGTPERKKLLDDAAGQFEQMHQRYRSQVGGLYGRLWQGKCYEEQGDLQKAMGIYNELLDHPGDSGPLVRLKDQTLQFKLIMLNLDARKDYQLVVDLAQEWLKGNGPTSRTRTGLGIRWELARSFELLGDDRALAKNDAERNWKLARNEAQNIVKFPGEYRDVAMAMIQRMDAKLGGKERDPANFDTAFGLGRSMISAIQELKKKIEVAKQTKQPAEEIKTLEQDLTNSLNEAARMFDLSLRLAGKGDEAKNVNQARYMLGYVYYLMRKNYESAILCQYVARTSDKESAAAGLDAAYLAMGAFVQAFNDEIGTTEQKEPDMGFIVKACNLIAERWPESDKANDARMTLGRIYTQVKRPLDAAEWFAKVPEADTRYADAQMASGQAYWSAYLGIGRKPDESPTSAQLAEWQATARKSLETGIAKLSAALPKEGAAPPELIAAKMSLAQIMVSQGQEADAIKLLLDDPHAVIKAVQVADESKRPSKGVQGRQFATESYKLLLRCYIGSGKLNEARATMTAMEKVAGGEAGGDITDLYVSLGRLLRDELDRFRKNGETDRYNNLMGSFETFLNDLAQRTDGQSFGSLSWIGETYFALGEVSESDPSRSATFFDKAGQAYGEVLSRAASDPNFAPPDQLLAVKLRQVRALRFKKDFEAAKTLVAEVLSQRSNDLRAQTEAAFVFQDWGASGDPDAIKHLTTALTGDKTIGAWGWGNLSNRLQNAYQNKPTHELLDSFLEVRYNVAAARRQLAQVQTSADQRTKDLDLAEMELVATVAILKDPPEDKLERLNEIYQQILADGGKEPKRLEAGDDYASVSEATLAEVEAEKAAAAEKATLEKVEPESPLKSNSLTFIIFGAVAVIGLAGIGFVMLKGSKTPRRHLVGSGPEAAPAFKVPAGFSVPTGIEAPSFPTAPPPRRTRPKPDEGTPAPKRPASSGEAPAKPRPRPKPPEQT